MHFQFSPVAPVILQAPWTLALSFLLACVSLPAGARANKTHVKAAARKDQDMRGLGWDLSVTSVTSKNKAQYTSLADGGFGSVTADLEKVKQ